MAQETLGVNHPNTLWAQDRERIFKRYGMFEIEDDDEAMDFEVCRDVSHMFFFQTNPVVLSDGDWQEQSRALGIHRMRRQLEQPIEYPNHVHVPSGKPTELWTSTIFDG